jgi:hypothetical protein
MEIARIKGSEIHFYNKVRNRDHRRNRGATEMTEKNTTEETLYEKCVLCGSLTNVRKTLPVEYRQNYIFGAGQICDDCAEVLKEIDDPNGLKVVE